MSDSLRPHGLQHTRLPCPSLPPRVCSNSSPLSRWCHPTISSFVTPFSSCPQSFPASGSFQMSPFFASGGQSIGASASALVLPVNIQGWFPSGLTDLMPLLSKGLSRVWVSESHTVVTFILSLTFSDPMDCIVPRILPQVRILEWVAYPFFRGSSQPRDQTRVSCIAGRFSTNWAMREAQESRVSSNTIRKHQFFSALPSFWSNSYICTWLLEKPQLWLCKPLSTKWCLCLLICFLHLSKGFFQRANVF